MEVNNQESLANSKVQCVVRMDSTKFMPNFPSFLALLMEFRFLKGASTIFLNVGCYFHSNAEIYLHNPTENVVILKMYNENNIFEADI